MIHLSDGVGKFKWRCFGLFFIDPINPVGEIYGIDCDLIRNRAREADVGLAIVGRILRCDKDGGNIPQLCDLVELPLKNRTGSGFCLTV